MVQSIWVFISANLSLLQPLQTTIRNHLVCGGTWQGVRWCWWVLRISRSYASRLTDLTGIDCGGAAVVVIHIITTNTVTMLICWYCYYLVVLTVIRREKPVNKDSVLGIVLALLLLRFLLLLWFLLLLLLLLSLLLLSPFTVLNCYCDNNCLDSPLELRFCYCFLFNDSNRPEATYRGPKVKGCNQTNNSTIFDNFMLFLFIVK